MRVAVGLIGVVVREIAPAYLGFVE